MNKSTSFDHLLRHSNPGIAADYGVDKFKAQREVQNANISDSLPGGSLGLYVKRSKTARKARKSVAQINYLSKQAMAKNNKLEGPTRTAVSVGDISVDV